MEQEIADLQQLLKQRENQIETLEAKLKAFANNTKQNGHQIEIANNYSQEETGSLAHKLEETTKKLEDCHREIEQLNSRLHKEHEESVKKDQNLVGFHMQIIALEQRNEDLENNLRNIIFEKDELEARVQELEERAFIEKDALIDQLNAKIEALERLRQQTVDYEDEIASLQRKRDELNLFETVKTTYSGSLSSDRLKLEEMMSLYQEEVDRLSKALEEQSEEIKRYECEKDKMQEEIGGLSERLKLKELEEIDEESELEKTKQEILSLRETLEDTDKKIQELNFKLHGSSDRSRDYTDRDYQLSIDKQEISTRDLEILQKNLKEMGLEISSLSEKIRHEKETNMKLQRENEKNTKEARNKDKKTMAQKTEITELKTSLTNERAKNADLEKKLAKLTREMEERNKKPQRAQKDVSTPKRGADTPKSPEKQAKETRLSASAVYMSSSDSQSAQRENANMTLDNGVLALTVRTFREEKVTSEESPQRERLIKDLTEKCEQNEELLQFVRTLIEENRILPEKLNKLAADVELLTDKMVLVQTDKQKLEKEMEQRERAIEDLAQKCHNNEEILQFAHNLQKENSSLSEKLNKMLSDVELLAVKMTNIQTEKLKLEKDVEQRELLIGELTQKCQVNNEVLEFVHNLEEENQYLSEKVNKIMDDVESLTSRMIMLQSEKLKLERGVSDRDEIIKDLKQKFDNNFGLLDLVKETEEENHYLTERLTHLAMNVQTLSAKFSELQSQKHQLELDAIKREAVINQLVTNYQELEKAIQYCKSEHESINISQSQLAPQSGQEAASPKNEGERASVQQLRLDSEGEASSTQDKTMTNFEDLLHKSKTTMNLCTNKLEACLSHANSFNSEDVIRRNVTQRHMSMQIQPENSPSPSPSKVSKYLYVKEHRALSSYIRFDNDQVVVSENPSTKKGSSHAGRTSTPKAEKSIKFNKILQKGNDFNLRIFNLKADNILGKSLFFFIYGAKRTDKKMLKHSLVQQVIDTFNSISQMNMEKICKLIMRIQDDKFFKKLEVKKNYTALEYFRAQQEFILNSEDNNRELEDFISQLQQFDTEQSLPKSGHLSPTSNTSAPKQIFMEFLIENKDGENELSASREPNFFTRTKIMIVTTNNIKDTKDLGHFSSAESMIEYILNGTPERKHEKHATPSSNVEKLFILSIQPELHNFKTITDTLALATRLNDIGSLEKVLKGSNPTHKKNNHSTSTKMKFEHLDLARTLSKEKSTYLHSLQNAETPKNKANGNVPDIRSIDLGTFSKAEKIVQENQKLVQQIEDYNKANPRGKDNMKRLLDSLTQSTPPFSAYKAKRSAKPSFSEYTSPTMSETKQKGKKGFFGEGNKKDMLGTF